MAAQDLLLVAGEIVRGLAAGALGVFAGAMLTEAGVLVPYWRSLAPPAFHAWYRANGARLVRFFGPLTWLAGVSALAAALLSLWTADERALWAALAAVLSLTVVAMFPIHVELHGRWRQASERNRRGGNPGCPP